LYTLRPVSWIPGIEWFSEKQNAFAPFSEKRSALVDQKHLQTYRTTLFASLSGKRKKESGYPKVQNAE
jgi:hypothetical protein